jgi:Domain of unknown function (DUF4411)
MTLYVLDANVLIRAHADYYPIDRIGPFWEWLLAMARANRVKVPREIYDEVAQSPDLLGQWLRQHDVREAIILAESTNGALVAEVIAKGYAPDLNDIEMETIGRDPFLVAAAMIAEDRVVVTREVSSPRKQRANRKVPDVCTTMKVVCIDDFELWRVLDFRIT